MNNQPDKDWIRSSDYNDLLSLYIQVKHERDEHIKFIAEGRENIRRTVDAHNANRIANLEKEVEKMQ